MFADKVIPFEKQSLFYILILSSQLIKYLNGDTNHNNIQHNNNYHVSLLFVIQLFLRFIFKMNSRLFILNSFVVWIID